MVKVHGKTKRKFNSARHLPTARPETRERKRRPKTFASEAIANKWAEAHGVTNFYLQNLRIGTKGKKLKVVVRQ